jgi:hypothetical protein
MSTAARDSRLLTLGRPLGVDSRFLLDEVEYALGRFLPEDLNSYLVVRREGRGQAPRMERPLRERLLNEVIAPYQQWKHGNGQRDWNDLAVFLAQNRVAAPYDVVTVDEAQKSANQVRAIVNHVSDDEMEHSTTLIRDSVQRIFPRAFTFDFTG